MIQEQHSRLGLVGLRNPSNMCFFNTALQCLFAVQPLREYFLERQYFRDINPGNPHGTFGEIAIKFAEFVSNLWCGTNPVYDPRSLRNCLSRYYNPYIEANDQQDSQ